jgi:hypothetical protein
MEVDLLVDRNAQDINTWGKALSTSLEIDGLQAHLVC